MLLAILLSTTTVSAKDNGQWADVDPEVRAWIQSLTVPNSSMSCCGEADAYEADLGEVGDDGRTYAVVTGTRGNPLPIGTKLLIPPEKVQNKQGNPSGHVIVFARADGYVYCFVPSGGV
jgi:hypothetical protein